MTTPAATTSPSDRATTANLAPPPALRERFGRRLNLAVLGGGPTSWIGGMHRSAAELDGLWRVAAGVFSSDASRSRAAGVALGFDPARSYGSLAELVERERSRDDGIDAVAIMTPNDSHYALSAAALDAGLDVICDKPVSATAHEADDLAARAAAGKRVFAVAHGYSAYPMTRYARHLVREGVLGPVRLVQVEYVQSGLATRLEDGPLDRRLGWILDPARSGLALVMGAIGCHAQHLACSVVGANIARVCADMTTLMPGRKVADHASALIEFGNGARGTFTATQAAAGSENDIRLRVIGERGLVEWSHRDASYLRVAIEGEPARIYGRGDKFLPASIIALGRTPRGHPEGLREAFANIYREMAQAIMARELGEAPPSLEFPRIGEAAHTMAFIEAAIASDREGRWVDVARPR